MTARAAPHPAPLVFPVLGALLVVAWSSGFVGIRYASDEAPIATILLWRSLVSGLVLLPFALWLGPRIPARALAEQALFAFLGMVLYLGGFALAIGWRVPTGLVALMADLVPLAIAALSWPVLGQRVGRRQWLGMAIGTLGVLAVSADALRLGDAPPLAYALPEFGVRLPFRPTDFTQVNPHINRVLVARALRLLQVQRDERVIDWFCGLGNFSLPLATQAAQVLGVEGSAALVARARQNHQVHADRPGLGPALAPADFVVRDLFDMSAEQLVRDGHAHRWLIDPPREGAFALVRALAAIHQARIGAEGAEPLPADAAGWRPPARIVYVSCNPATLARDAGLLVHQAGYRCSAAGVVNMFPHTAHVESMAVFDRVDPADTGDAAKIA